MKLIEVSYENGSEWKTAKTTKYGETKMTYEKIVNVINKTYGHFKNEIVSLSESDYKKFSTKFIETAKSLNEVVEIASIVAVMNGWRESSKLKNNNRI